MANSDSKSNDYRAEESREVVALVKICPNCEHEVDVGKFEPLSKISCENCGNEIIGRSLIGQRYRLSKLIAEGGMSSVYLAVDEKLDRRIAVKVLNYELSRDESKLKAFEREARLTASILHKNVVQVYDVGRDFGCVFIAMEFIEGESLENLIRERGVLSVEECVDVASQMISGLQAAYAKNLLHRDIKPGNVLVKTGDDGNIQEVKLVDFGLAIVEGHKDEQDEIWATPQFVAPEKLVDEREDVRSDIYSLGVMLFHLVSGKFPHDSESEEMDKLLEAKQKSPAREHLPKNMDDNFARYIFKMLSFDPDKRQQDYGQLLLELETLGKKKSASQHGKAAKSSFFRRVAILAILALAIVFIFSFLRNSNDDKASNETSANIKDEANYSNKAPDKDADNSDIWRNDLAKVRDEISTGKLAAAQKTLQSMNEDSALPLIAKAWARWHSAHLGLLLGEVKSTRKNLDNLLSFCQSSYAKSLPNSHEFRKIMPFFSHSSETTLAILDGKKAAPSPARLGKSARVLRDLLFAGAFWERGDRSEARKLFQKTKSWSVDAKAQGGKKWLSEYAKLADDFLDLEERMQALPSFVDTEKFINDENWNITEVRKWQNRCNELLSNKAAVGDARRSLQSKLGNLTKIAEHFSKRQNKAIRDQEQEFESSDADIYWQYLENFWGKASIDEKLTKMASVEFKSEKYQELAELDKHFISKARDFIPNLIDICDKATKAGLTMNAKDFGFKFNSKMTHNGKLSFYTQRPNGLIKIDLKNLPARYQIETALKSQNFLAKSNGDVQGDWHDFLESVIAYAFLNKEIALVKENAKLLAETSSRFAKIWQEKHAYHIFVDKKY